MSPKVQRIGIFIIAIVMIVGTLGSFALMVLSTDNAQNDYEKQLAEQQKATEALQKETDELSSKYYPVFSEYKDAPKPFDAESVGDTVLKSDLKEGAGEEITRSTSYKAYYLGWTPDGNAFDSSFDGETLKSPLDPGQMNLIPGWYEGVEGMKVGGVREITIPSDLAYGASGSGAIKPNTPIKFIIMVAEKN